MTTTTTTTATNNIDDDDISTAKRKTGRPPYKIRYDKVREGLKILKETKCLDGTADQKLTFLFCDLKKHREGWLFKELCLIMHPDKLEKDPETSGSIPTYHSYMQTRQEIKEYRQKRNLKSGVIVYCLWNDELKLELYFNISTLQLLDIVEKRNEKIIKGLKRNVSDAKKFLKLPPSLKRQLSRTARNELRQQIMEKIQREQAAKRKKEMEEAQQIYA